MKAWQWARAHEVYGLDKRQIRRLRRRLGRDA